MLSNHSFHQSSRFTRIIMTNLGRNIDWWLQFSMLLVVSASLNAQDNEILVDSKQLLFYKLNLSYGEARNHCISQNSNLLSVNSSSIARALHAQIVQWQLNGNGNTSIQSVWTDGISDNCTDNVTNTEQARLFTLINLVITGNGTTKYLNFTSRFTSGNESANHSFVCSRGIDQCASANQQCQPDATAIDILEFTVCNCSHGYDSNMTCLPGNATMSTPIDEIEFNEQTANTFTVTRLAEELTASVSQLKNLNQNQTESISNHFVAVGTAAKLKGIPIESHAFKKFVRIASMLNNAITSSPTGNVKSYYQVVSSLESLGANVILPANQSFRVYSTETVTFKVSDEQFNSSDTSQAVSFAPNSLSSDVTDQNSGSITLPHEALAIASAETQGPKLRIVFALFEGNAFFQSEKKPERVILATINGTQSISNLKSPVVIRLSGENTTHGKQPKEKPKDLKVKYIHQTCFFWDVAIDDWSTKGCCLDTTQSVPTCLCDHLTNFALIFSETEVPANAALTIFSQVGCGVSVVFLLITILLHLLNKQVLALESCLVQLHVFCNLFVVYLTFLVGIDRVSDNIPCIIITVILHFAFLASFFWMAIFGHKLYISLVKVVNVSSGNYLWKATAFAYGVPAVIVGANVALSYAYFDQLVQDNEVCDAKNVSRTSTYRADHACWIHGKSLYFSFLLVVGLILLANLIIMLLVIKSVLFGKKIRSSKAKRSKVKEAMMVFTLSVSLGITWFIGFFILLYPEEKYQIALSWAFTALNAFQGVFIFYLTCIRRKEMLHFWLDPIKNRCCCLSNKRAISLASSSRTNETSFSTNTGRRTDQFQSQTAPKDFD